MSPKTTPTAPTARASVRVRPPWPAGLEPGFGLAGSDVGAAALRGSPAVIQALLPGDRRGPSRSSAARYAAPGASASGPSGALVEVARGRQHADVSRVAMHDALGVFALATVGRGRGRAVAVRTGRPDRRGRQERQVAGAILDRLDHQVGDVAVAR